MTAEQVTTHEAEVRVAGPIPLHRDPRLDDALLGELARRGIVIQAPCGDRRVPLRPPFPENAVRCPICHELADGAFR